MRKRLFFCLLLLSPILASAQLPISLAAGLLVNGTQAAAKAARNRAGKPGEFVTYFRVGADSVAMKRTPPEKLRGDAATSIRDEEALLQRCHQTYLKPGPLSLELEWVYSQQQLQRIAATQPKWDIKPYQQEIAFYQREQQRRLDEQRRQQLHAYQVAHARQDSLTRLEQRRRVQQDSLRAVAYARRQAYNDSVAAVADRVFSRQRAVADSLAQITRTTMTRPVATAIARPATTVSRPAAPRKPAARPPVARPAARPAAGGVVYMCNSGNVVKYHATSGCRGLNRCGASVVRISKADAQQSMDPCKFCY